MARTKQTKAGAAAVARTRTDMDVAIARGRVLAAHANGTPMDDTGEWGFPLIEALDLSVNRTDTEVDAATRLMPATWRQCLRGGWRRFQIDTGCHGSR